MGALSRTIAFIDGDKMIAIGEQTGTVIWNETEQQASWQLDDWFQSHGVG